MGSDPVTVGLGESWGTAILMLGFQTADFSYISYSIGFLLANLNPFLTNSCDKHLDLNKSKSA
jgi:hypothetical protein